MDLTIPKAEEVEVSSVLIAQRTGKKHYHIMRDIRKQLKEQEIDESKFGSVYIDGKGEQRNCFKLDEKQSMILAMGYSVELRAKMYDLLVDLRNNMQKIVDDQVRRKMGILLEHRQTDLNLIQCKEDRINDLSRDVKELIINAVNDGIDLKDALNRARGIKSHDTRKRKILDSIKEILGVRNDRDIVPVLRNNNQIMNLIEEIYG